jgi:hypothetical protein
MAVERQRVWFGRRAKIAPASIGPTPWSLLRVLPAVATIAVICDLRR